MTTLDRDRQIDELIDREAIRQLPARYCHFVRTRNIEAIIDLYAEDGVFDMPANMAEGGVRSGKAAIEETFRRGLVELDPWPFTHNHVIDLLDASRASGFVYVEFRLGTQNYRTTHIGVYEDAYVKEDGRWKFQSRKLTSVVVPA
jgi:hypothetical protein